MDSDIGDFILLTVLDVGDLFRHIGILKCNKSVTNISNQFQTANQHISSPTSVTNIDMTLMSPKSMTSIRCNKISLQKMISLSNQLINQMIGLQKWIN